MALWMDTLYLDGDESSFQTFGRTWHREDMIAPWELGKGLGMVHK